MLQKYFDVSNLMRTVNLSTLMMSAILNKEQRLLLMFQRRMVIEDRPTDHASSDDHSNEDIVQTFHGQLTSNKPFDRIFALGKITSILKGYENNPPD